MPLSKKRMAEFPAAKRLRGYFYFG